MAKICKLLFLTVTGFISYKLYNYTKDREPPKLAKEFWGPASEAGKSEDKSIRPFNLSIEQGVIEDLKNRLTTELANDRLTEPLEGIGFQYGFNTKFLKTLGNHWLRKYDWRQREKFLNKYQHFKTKISGIDIHFLHIKGSDSKKYKKTVPLLMVHGWPGSFVEFYKIAPLLTEPKNSDVSFQLIIPSIPGYGFSGAAHKHGFTVIETAQIFHELMTRLGHEKYYLQGGDWGALIVTMMSAIFPDNIIGVHMNICFSNHPRTHIKNILGHVFPSFFMTEEEYSKSLIHNFGELMKETGYVHIQSTKPDTVGVGLSNSPLGLAAYILEKFSSWTNGNWESLENGGLVPYFDLDELLDNIMIYWVSNSITTSMRFYAENFSKKVMLFSEIESVPVFVPAGCYSPPTEKYYVPKYTACDKYRNLVQYTYGDKGGHFTAFEAPVEMAEDFLGFFEKVEKMMRVSNNSQEL